MGWADQPVGTWELKAHVTPGGGEVKDLGCYKTFRTCVEIARALAREPDTVLNRFSASYKRSDNRNGGMVDGFSRHISLKPDGYDPDTELMLSDGRVVWLGDVNDILIRAIEQEEAAAAIEAQCPKGGAHQPTPVGRGGLRCPKCESILELAD